MFKAPFSFNGRITRTEYIMSTCLAFFLLGFTGLLITGSEGLAFLISVTILWFWIAQGAKRCHDFGQAGLLQVIPVINPIALWLFQGASGPNQYGPDPRNPALAPPPLASPAPPAPIRPPLTTPPAYRPPTKVASFRCGSCGAQNKDVSYTQSPSCEFCGSPRTGK